MWKLGGRNVEDLHLFLDCFVGSYCLWLFLFGVREVIGLILVFLIVWGKMKGRLIDLLKKCLKFGRLLL